METIDLAKTKLEEMKAEHPDTYRKSESTGYYVGKTVLLLLAAYGAFSLFIAVMGAI